MTKQNRLTDYEARVIEHAEAWEKAALMQTGQAHIHEKRLLDFIRSSKREPRRVAAKDARTPLLTGAMA